MARRRYRKREEGLIEIAIRSDWKLSAGLAAACLVVGMVLIPRFLAGNVFAGPLVGVSTPLSGVLALCFAGIALIRYIKQASAAAPAHAAGGHTCPARPDGQHHALHAPAGNLSAFTEAMTTFAPAIQPAAPKPVTPAPPPRPESWSLDVLNRIEWKRFEDLCCAFYREKGICAETTRLGADGGIDIHLFLDAANPTRVTSIVQCKAWSKPVGVKDVRELRGVMAHRQVDRAFFMAPNGYTDDARAFASENRITLLDGKLFLAMLQRLPEDARQRLLAFATEGDWTTPTCPGCGDRMTARSSARGAFWGCVRFPKCKSTLPMRASARS